MIFFILLKQQQLQQKRHLTFITDWKRIFLCIWDHCDTLCDLLPFVQFKVNESWYIVLFVFRGATRKLFSIDYVNIYFYSIFPSIDLALWRGVELPHMAYIVNH